MSKETKHVDEVQCLCLDNKDKLYHVHHDIDERGCYKAVFGLVDFLKSF